MTGRWDDGSMFIDGAWTPDDTARVGEVIDHPGSGRRCCVGWRTSSMSATTRSRNW